jgi:hypothetical protein
MTTTTMKTTRTISSTTTSSALAEKGRRLHGILAGYQSVLIAFSGGVDSAYLAVAASTALGDRALSVTADSASYPDSHRRRVSIASASASLTRSSTPASSNAPCAPTPRTAATTGTSYAGGLLRSQTNVAWPS